MHAPCMPHACAMHEPCKHHACPTLAMKNSLRILNEDSGMKRQFCRRRCDLATSCISLISLGSLLLAGGALNVSCGRKKGCMMY